MVSRGACYDVASSFVGERVGVIYGRSNWFFSKRKRMFFDAFVDAAYLQFSVKKYLWRKTIGLEVAINIF